MNRILGIDYGSAKTGLAISDLLCIISRDLEVIYKKTDEEKVARIKEICTKEKVNLIIMGMPLNMDGSQGFQAQEVLEFSELLKEIGIEIKFLDERMSTQIAESIMKEMKYSHEDIKKKSDAKAASVILQEYLDYHR